MGMIGGIWQALVGGGNLLPQTVELFRPNAEAEAQRGVGLRDGAMAQFAGEFAAPRRGRFDRVMDGLNRLPRPALALGTLGLFAAAMVDPLWFAARMQGLALVPEPLWWLLGVIVSFYFGARYQVKHQAFQRDLASSLARAPQVRESLAALERLRADSPGAAETGADAALTLAALGPEENPALENWRRQRSA
ncbi:holin family protein [Pseudodonghicola flavimaris]|uniref:Holin family protein n=1 Tax=Pseudodonghicola flavimaris TaxID=3050036 RepID=A0ABT7F1M2_9RHOB|nr:holin family protein [Pseudodonghicola flavimaris]MDK3018501.1 holin family protein [Pseudodonghicola flavimaris]